MPDFTFHLIPNAHLDPVWLWDWREGLNEGLVTCRTILDLMDHDRELTFIRDESFCRHFLHGQRYFASRFGKSVRAAWAADSFGHCAGLPEILAAAGIEFFAFTRPPPDVLPLDKPAFWWEGAGGSRILAYRPSP